jgi:hypothetical protein
LDKLEFLSYTTKKSLRTIRTRKIISINNKAVLRKPVKVINKNNNSVHYFCLHANSVEHKDILRIRTYIRNNNIVLENKWK